MNVDLTSYLLDIPDEPILFEGPADVLAAMRGMGYEGDWWMKCKPLTEGQWQERRAQSVIVAADSDTGEGRASIDFGRHWYYAFSKCIIQARLPLPRRGVFEELVVDKPSSKTAEALIRLHPENRVLIWVEDTLAKMQSGPEAQAEAEVGKFADLSASASSEDVTPDAADESGRAVEHNPLTSEVSSSSVE